MKTGLEIEQRISGLTDLIGYAASIMVENDPNKNTGKLKDKVSDYAKEIRTLEWVLNNNL